MIAHPLPWCRLGLLKVIYAELITGNQQSGRLDERVDSNDG